LNTKYLLRVVRLPNSQIESNGDTTMSETRNSLLCLASLVALLATLGMKATARGAYESAEYTVLKSDGPFEIRKYPDLMLASTKLALNAGANDGGFMVGRFACGLGPRQNGQSP
jgi:hypothetical protein